VFDHTVIGDGTTIWSGVVIREKTVIGKQCIIHSNSTIGADGFGYRYQVLMGEDW
jgi:UDP-3-O-[3-hydroxymyristoyl] glucosamine N-acyltransferase